MKIREEVLKFAEEMERILRYHDEKKGDTWKRDNQDWVYYRYSCEPPTIESVPSITWFNTKLEQKYRKYNETGDPKELVNLANICMMLYYHHEGLKDNDRK